MALAGSVSLGLAFAQTRPAPRAATETKARAASREQLNKILDAMLYQDRAVLPLALHVESELYNLDAPAETQHVQTLVMEQRADGKRLDAIVSVRSLRNGQLQERQVNRSIFTGDQYLYRQQLKGDRSYPVSASLYPKNEALRILANEYTLLGCLPGDEKPVGTLLQNASGAVLYDHREDVDGFACDVIEGTTDHGVYKLWIDPEHDYRIRRAIIDKGANDLYYGKPVSTPRPEGMQDQTLTSVHMEISEVHLEKLGDRFLPTAETVTTTDKTVTGKENHSKLLVKRSQIDLEPDFEKLGAFVMDEIPEGTSLNNFDPNDHTYAYEWHNGKAVSVAPDGGVVAGRIQFSGHADLSTVLTGKRSFRALFAPVSTSEGAGGRGSRNLALTPETNGAFQVKDVPPGRYRLELSLTDLVVERTPSGGFVGGIKRIVEADREFSIPEVTNAAQKTIDLGVIEMALPSSAESSGGTDAAKRSETTAPADEKTAGRQRFDEIYRLAEGEVLKRIGPPYLPERMKHYPGGRDSTMPRDFEQKLTMVFLWDGQLRVWGASTSPANPLGSVLSSVLRLQSYEYEGPKALLDLRLPPGDWIIRDKVPQEVKLRALEELVARELKRTIRFEKRTVKREVLFATGRFQFHPPIGTYENTAVHLYATATDPTESAGGGTAFSVREFLQKLGDMVNVPVISQAEPNSPLNIPYRHHRSAYLGVIEDPRERARELKVLLEHLTAQTELQFEVRREPVEVWYVTE